MRPTGPMTIAELDELTCDLFEPEDCEDPICCTPKRQFIVNRFREALDLEPLGDAENYKLVRQEDIELMKHDVQTVINDHRFTRTEIESTAQYIQKYTITKGIAKEVVDRGWAILTDSPGLSSGVTRLKFASKEAAEYGLELYIKKLAELREQV